MWVDLLIGSTLGLGSAIIGILLAQFIENAHSRKGEPEPEPVKIQPPDANRKPR